MRGKLGNLFMILGIVLVGMALSLFLYNRWDSDRAGRASEEVLEQLLDLVEEDTGGNADIDLDEEVLKEDTVPEMRTVTIDGYEYIGYLNVPSLQLTLPVMAQWSYEGLKVAPGRFSGNVYSDDLVICGHNYARHFSPLKWIPAGTKIDFIDMEGRTWTYEVEALETLQPTQVKEMTEKTDGDDWDLTLYTCNTGGQTRCAVRCVRTSARVSTR